MSRNVQMFRKPDMVYDFINACKVQGHDVTITSVDRDYKEQYALYCQGREPLDVVNEFRKIACLPPISQAENQKKVTWTLNSKHIINLDDERKDNDKSDAIDFVILKNGKAIWDVKADVNADKQPDYKQCALIGESLGFISGMRFKNPDYPHLELPKE